jgi:hypothetical protein
MGRLIVVEDFYEDPWRIRAGALACEFSKQAQRPKLCEWLESFPASQYEAALLRMAELIGHNVTYEPRYQGFFRVLTASAWQRVCNSGIIVHVDKYDWLGVVGLTEAYVGALSFYRHKSTGVAEVPPDYDARDAYPEDAGDLTRWEIIQTVELRFNRLVLFTPRAFHVAAPGVGGTPADGKLTQQFQFDEDDEDAEAVSAQRY